MTREPSENGDPRGMIRCKQLNVSEMTSLGSSRKALSPEFQTHPEGDRFAATTGLRVGFSTGFPRTRLSHQVVELGYTSSQMCANFALRGYQLCHGIQLFS